MGFPVGYSELLRLLLHLLFLVGQLRRGAAWLFHLAGADADADASAAEELTRGLDKHSPAARFAALAAGGGGARLPEGCSVCLGDFDGAAEVRRPRRCRHVFHRACLDRWAAHGQRTCPLCRAPLLLPPVTAPAVLLPAPLPAA